MTELKKAEAYLHQLKGKPRAKKFYRCKHCRKRRVLKRELWEYLNPPQCEGCGKRDWLIDMHRYNEWLHKTGGYAVCHCGGLDHKHRPASSIWCHQHPDEPTQEDYEARFRGW